MATVTQATKKALRADADPAGPRGCTNFKLRQLTRRVSQHCEPYFAASGLKTTQYALLSHIDLLGPVQPIQLARRMGLDTSTLSRNLQPLLAGDWVERLPGGDARSSQVRASAAGREKRAAMKADWKRAQLSINARLGEERVQRLHALLDECLALLDDGSA